MLPGVPKVTVNSVSKLYQHAEITCPDIALLCHSGLNYYRKAWHKTMAKLIGQRVPLQGFFRRHYRCKCVLDEADWVNSVDEEGRNVGTLDNSERRVAGSMHSIFGMRTKLLQSCTEEASCQGAHDGSLC